MPLPAPGGQGRPPLRERRTGAARIVGEVDVLFRIEAARDIVAQ